MVCPMAQAASAPSAPTAAALSYRGRSKVSLLASRATAPPSSSTEINSGMSEASCRAALKAVICSGSTMFLPNWHTPPTGYFCSASRMASVSSVTPSALASSICSCGRVRSRESGRIMNSWPTFSSSVRSAAVKVVSAAGVGSGVGPASSAGRSTPTGRSVFIGRVTALCPVGCAPQAHSTPASKTGQTNHFFISRYPFCRFCSLYHIPSKGARELHPGIRGQV